MKAKTVKEVLIAAQWILINKGWGTRNYAETTTGEKLWWGKVVPNIKCACAMGAIGLVSADLTIKTKAADLLYLEVGDNVAQWNDAPGRTKEEVIQLYDRIISKQEAIELRNQELNNRVLDDQGETNGS